MADRSLESYRIDPSAPQAKAVRTTGEELVRKFLELMGTNDPESTFAPAADFTLKEPAQSILAKIVNKVINNRNEVYHGTWPAPAAEILRTGEIKPNVKLNSGLRNFVSTSRTPEIETFKETPIRLALDANKLPTMQSTAEFAFEKTRPVYGTEGEEMIPNKYFEFENRTKGGPISTDAIKKILLKDNAYLLPEDIKAFADSGIPVERIPSAQMPTYRARQAWADYLKLKQNPMGTQVERVPSLVEILANIQGK